MDKKEILKKIEKLEEKGLKYVKFQDQEILLFQIKKSGYFKENPEYFPGLDRPRAFYGDKPLTKEVAKAMLSRVTYDLVSDEVTVNIPDGLLDKLDKEFIEKELKNLVTKIVESVL